MHLIDNHISEYGHYGIGLSKEWAIKNQLNPVIYLEEHSALTDCFGTIFDTISDDCVENFFDNISNNKDNPELLKYFQNVLEHLWKIFCYLKPYKCFIKNKCFINKKEKIFYEENEWRYLPARLHKPLECGGIFGLILFKEDETEEKVNAIKNILKKEPLTFCANDIKYIFIDKEEERERAINTINGIKEKYSPQEKKILCSKILSVSQLKNDV